MNWSSAPLEAVVDFVGGGTPVREREEFWQGSIPWASPKDFTGRRILDTAEHISEQAVAQSATQVVPPESVLVVVRSGILVRRFPVAINMAAMAVNQDVKGLLPHPGLDPSFLAYALDSSSATVLGNCVKRGATVHSIDMHRLRALPIPTPTPSEQRRIVGILDRADELRGLRGEADARAERVLPALFQEVFGGSNESDRGRLGDLLLDRRGALQSGPFGSHLHNSDFVDDGEVLAVGVDNVLDSGFDMGRRRRITREKYRELQKYTLAPGDVLLTIMGTVGRTCVFPEGVGTAICTKHVYRIQVGERLNPEYLSAVLRFSGPVRAQLRAKTTGQIVEGVTSSALRDLVIPVPPRLAQDTFAQHKRGLDRARDLQRQSRALVDNLFALLLHRAFSGKLTAAWREAHMKELLQEMEQQARALGQAVPSGTSA